MEKITGLAGIAGLIKPENKQKADTDLFRQNLNQAMEGTSPNLPTAPTGGLGEIQAMTRIEGNEATITRKTDHLLGLMDQYAEKLGNPQNTLKEIEPLLGEIQKDALELMEEAGKSGNTHTDIYKIANQSAVTAGVEYVKFSRGDYI